MSNSQLIAYINANRPNIISKLARMVKGSILKRDEPIQEFYHCIYVLHIIFNHDNQNKLLVPQLEKKEWKIQYLSYGNHFLNPSAFNGKQLMKHQHKHNMDIENNLIK